MSCNQTECEVMAEAAEEVKGIVTGDRNKCYGTPSENHDVTGIMWGAYLSRKFGIKLDITGEDVCWLNNLQKASRQAHWSQRDNAIDAAGYALNAIACRHAQDQIKESSKQDTSLQTDCDRRAPRLHPESISTDAGQDDEGGDFEPFDLWLHRISIRNQRVPSEAPQADRFPTSKAVFERIPKQPTYAEVIAHLHSGSGSPSY